MIRKDREIKDMAQIIDILNRCDTVRIGITGAEYPYAVPVSFGFAVDNDVITVYFHCAKIGYKLQLLEKNPNVCVEGDIFIKVEPHERGITTRYESVIGFGKAETVTGEEKLAALRAILGHYGYADYAVEDCKNLPVTTVYKITLAEITGKRNLPKPD